MPIPFRFRPATQADWPAVSQLLASSQLPLDGAYEHLDTFELAFKNDVLVGVAGLEIYGKAALLRSIAVLETERGHGLGQQLTERAIKQAQALGLHQLVLLTETAKAFFPRFSFQPIARADAPQSVQASVEFQGACPDSATVMQLHLAPLSLPA